MRILFGERLVGADLGDPGGGGRTSGTKTERSFGCDLLSTQPTVYTAPYQITQRIGMAEDLDIDSLCEIQLFKL